MQNAMGGGMRGRALRAPRFALRLILALLLSIALSAHPAALALSPEDYDPQHPEVLESDLLYAESAFLFDMDTMDVILSKNSKVRIYPASTTKMMTALLALESGIDLDQEVTIPKAAGDVPEGSSVVGLKPGDRMSWRDLLYGLMLRSGNDAANAIAVLVSGSVDDFVRRMNERAKELHCEGTHFVNAHGYHNSDHYTTAQDLARIAWTAMQMEDFRQIVSAGHWEITLTRGDKTRSSDAENRNLMLVEASEYYYPEATGIKTGHHRKSGRCVVASAQREGVRLIAVVMDCDTEDEQYADAKKLFEYGFSQYEPVTMTELTDEILPEVAQVTVDNAQDDGQLTLGLGAVTGGEATCMIRSGSEKGLSYALSAIRETMAVAWNRTLTAPVKQGEVLGVLRFVAPDGSQVSAELISPRDVAPLPSPTPEPTAVPEVVPQGHSRRGVLILISALLILLILTVGLLVILQARRARHRRRRRPSGAKKRAGKAPVQRSQRRQGR